MDWWDPPLINTIGSKREVILFDNRGVGRTGGDVPDSFQGWADDMIAFVTALGIAQVDYLGFSLGARADDGFDQTWYCPQDDLGRRFTCNVDPDSPKDVRDPKYVMGMATAKTYDESKDAFRLALFGESTIGRRHFEEYWHRLEQRKAEPALLEALELDPGGNN